jgi:hypothetical protein
MLIILQSIDSLAADDQDLNKFCLARRNDYKLVKEWLEKYLVNNPQHVSFQKRAGILCGYKFTSKVETKPTFYHLYSPDGKSLLFPDFPQDDLDGSLPMFSKIEIIGNSVKLTDWDHEHIVSFMHYCANLDFFSRYKCDEKIDFLQLAKTFLGSKEPLDKILGFFQYSQGYAVYFSSKKTSYLILVETSSQGKVLSTSTGEISATSIDEILFSANNKAMIKSSRTSQTGEDYSEEVSLLKLNQRKWESSFLAGSRSFQFNPSEKTLKAFPGGGETEDSYLDIDKKIGFSQNCSAEKFKKISLNKGFIEIDINDLENIRVARCPGKLYKVDPCPIKADYLPGQVIAAGVRLRDQADGSGKIIQQLKYGTQIGKCDEKDSMAKVFVGSSDEYGWINTRFIGVALTKDMLLERAKLAETKNNLNEAIVWAERAAEMAEFERDTYNASDDKKIDEYLLDLKKRQKDRKN